MRSVVIEFVPLGPNSPGISVPELGIAAEREILRPGVIIPAGVDRLEMARAEFHGLDVAAEAEKSKGSEEVDYLVWGATLQSRNQALVQERRAVVREALAAGAGIDLLAEVARYERTVHGANPKDAHLIPDKLRRVAEMRRGEVSRAVANARVILRNAVEHTEPFFCGYSDRYDPYAGQRSALAWMLSKLGALAGEVELTMFEPGEMPYEVDVVGRDEKTTKLTLHVEFSAHLPSALPAANAVSPSSPED